MNKIIIAIIVSVSLLISCKTSEVATKDINYMQLKFKPLERTDFTIVGNLESESVVSGTYSGGKKNLSKEFSKNYKKGLITTREKTEMMYFAPKEGQTITGSLYENEIFNSIFFSAQPGVVISNPIFDRIKQKLFGMTQNIIADPGVDFAYYEMVNKYPEIDYFVNVRFDRHTTYSKKGFTEKVVVKADGIILRTDN
jgi:hypothetical protein